MNLYVYTLNTFFSNRPKGIHMEKVEARETPKTYMCDSYGTGYTSRIRKQDIGLIINGRIILTEPNFEYAKNKFKEMGEATVRLQKERLENAENVLKIINESEEN